MIDGASIIAMLIGFWMGWKARSIFWEAEWWETPLWKRKEGGE